MWHASLFAVFMGFAWLMAWNKWNVIRLNIVRDQVNYNCMTLNVHMEETNWTKCTWAFGAQTMKVVCNISCFDIHLAKDGIRRSPERRWHGCSTGGMQGWETPRADRSLTHRPPLKRVFIRLLYFPHSCWLLQPQGFLRQGRSVQQVFWWCEEGFRNHWSGQEWLHWGGWTQVRATVLFFILQLDWLGF